ncbi:type I DNA topoisomerase [Flagellimonas zhangzhouensis]|uniref:DNA topoisomerase 1 n=1 Tax=Flagellimonas zhangzhouensis TaxID=1073328 RepID=A0A1H2VS92_9FLAO|nr:type I DNA topoisomerase [Allomuricauda zhangzhouensis]SDQ05929.1 DNA topoisomerase I [Allomuricauda zhangzhouensis]SDW71253.1 DNA topoisomerase I [Allomuricauda zhangzhouensis]
MPKNLVIVESPAKAKTIERFLGKDYQVESSFGHIVDLPSKELGVDVDNQFKPKYTVDREKKALVKKLKDLANKAETIWLASDEDREGEAISWHLAEELGLDKSKTKRIVFNSITKSAIQKAIENPRDINYNLVNAQQARRVLDRLVGYELSPVLWKKIKPGLSAGRVQSVAVRLIVERERDIEGFTPEASFRIKAEFKTADGSTVSAKLNKTFSTQQEAESFLKDNIGADFSVVDLSKKPAKKSPAPPFTTSTLQQEASRKLYFSVSRTMQVAQRLYEAGLITYMRTDSVNLSNEALAAAKEAIVQNYGDEYSQTRNFTGKTKGAQEAHEAIRPTDMKLQNPQLERDQSRLYELIWKRTLASQMSDAQLERTNVKIKASTHQEEFTANGEVVQFDGFLKVYLEGTDDEDNIEEQEGMLPALSVGESLNNIYISATERFTRPPYRFTEASLVKKLEELGIGRPSTYAPTISTIQNRGYVEKGTVEGTERNYVQLVLEAGTVAETKLSEMVGSDKGKLVPTDIGMIVNDFLVTHFTQILDYNFTAQVEEDFDEIASGDEDWQKMMENFYKEFHPNVIEVEENAERASGERVLGVDPKTGRQVSVRLGRFGPMVQIGTVEEEEKPLFASLLPDQSLATITFEEAMTLFELPRKLGEYEGEEVEANVGRFGPYVRFGKKFISLDKGESAFDVDMDRAIELIKAKQKADAPIATYEGKDVTKGVGRFGPFIKWDGMFINVNKKYDFDNLSQADINELIEAKKIKEAEKLVQEWPEEKIRIEKARWGRHNIIKGRVKVELTKDVDATKVTLEEAKALIEKKTPKKKAKAKAKK